MAALLLTIVFWLVVWGLHTAEAVVLQFKLRREYPPIAQRFDSTDTDGMPTAKKTVEKTPGKTDEDTTEKASDKTDATAGVQSAPVANQPTADQVTAAETAAPASPDEEPPQAQDAGGLDMAYRVLHGIKSFLPKTAETSDLLQRSLVDLAELPPGLFGESQRPDVATQKLIETYRNRSVAWIVGTSLAFEAIILALAAWVFCRRDFSG
jgi:hypothetical protein